MRTMFGSADLVAASVVSVLKTVVVVVESKVCGCVCAAARGPTFASGVGVAGLGVALGGVCGVSAMGVVSAPKRLAK